MLGIYSFGLGIFAVGTGGAGPIVCGLLMAAVGVANTAAGAGLAASAIDTTIDTTMKEFVQASFFYELLQRGHARLESRTSRSLLLDV